MKRFLINYPKEEYVSLIFKILTRIPQLLLPMLYQAFFQMSRHTAVTLKTAHVEYMIVQEDHYPKVVNVHSVGTEKLPELHTKSNHKVVYHEELYAPA